MKNLLTGQHQPKSSRNPRRKSYNTTLVNKLVPCAWDSSGAIEALRLLLRLRMHVIVVCYALHLLRGVYTPSANISPSF